jgi:hypothetical protein
MPPSEKQQGTNCATDGCESHEAIEVYCGGGFLCWSALDSACCRESAKFAPIVTPPMFEEPNRKRLCVMAFCIFAGFFALILSWLTIHGVIAGRSRENVYAD